MTLKSLVWKARRSASGISYLISVMASCLEQICGVTAPHQKWAVLSA